MSVVQIVLLSLCIPSGLYQMAKLGQTQILFARHGEVVFTRNLWIALLITWVVEVTTIVAFVRY